MEGLQGIQYTGASLKDDSVGLYKEGYQVYETFLGGNDYILENYIVNYLYRNSLPIISKMGVFHVCCPTGRRRYTDPFLSHWDGSLLELVDE